MQLVQSHWAPHKPRVPHTTPINPYFEHSLASQPERLAHWPAKPAKHHLCQVGRTTTPPEDQFGHTGIPANCFKPPEICGKWSFMFSNHYLFFYHFLSRQELKNCRSISYVFAGKNGAWISSSWSSSVKQINRFVIPYLLWARKWVNLVMVGYVALVSPLLSNVISGQWVDATIMTSTAEADLDCKTQNS